MDCKYKAVLINITNNYTIPDVPAGQWGVTLTGYFDISGTLLDDPFYGSSWAECDGTRLKVPWDCSVNVPQNGEGKVNFTVTIPSSGQPTGTSSTDTGGATGLASVPYTHAGYEQVMGLSAAGTANALAVSDWVSRAPAESVPGLKSVFCRPTAGGCDLYL